MSKNAKISVILLLLMLFQNCTGQENNQTLNDRLKIENEVRFYLQPQYSDSVYMAILQKLDDLKPVVTDSAKLELYYYESIFLLRLNKYDEAKQSIDLVLNKDSSNYLNWFQKGLIYDFMNKNRFSRYILQKEPKSFR